MSNNIRSVNNLNCSICCEIYKQTDNIQATECGHVFHLNCLENWLGRVPNCPICRIHNPNNFKLFLNFDEQRNNDAVTALNMSEYENLLYETNLYREEIQYLKERLADTENQLKAQKEKALQLEEHFITLTFVSDSEDDIVDGLTELCINNLSD